MNKNLLVQIFVPTRDGLGEIGVGYPVIGAGFPTNRYILTAKHLLFPKDRDDRKDIEVRWYHLENKQEDRKACDWRRVKEVTWVGQDELDVALLTCDFPQSVREWGDWGFLSAEMPKNDILWCSEGFAKAGRKEDGSREPVPLKGRTYSMGGSRDSYFVLGVDDPTSLPDGWKGASGSPVFVDGRIIGVIVTCQKNFAARRLTATPVLRLVEDPAFRKCLGYDERIVQLDDICDRVTYWLLKSPKVMECIRAELLVENLIAIKVDVQAKGLAKTLAKLDIDKLLPLLDRVHARLSDELIEASATDGQTLQHITGLLLPVIFDAAVVHGMRIRIAGGQSFALVDLPAATKTLAEIVMAGTDRRPAEFQPSTTRRDFPAGQLCLQRPPETGIDPELREFQKAWNKQMIDEFLAQGDRERFMEDQLIELASDQLTYDVTKLGRTRYCFFDLPRDESGRNVWGTAIGQLKKLYPSVVFIKLRDDFATIRHERLRFSPLRDMLYFLAKGRREL